MKMKRVASILVTLVLAAAALGILLSVYFVTAGVSARPQPGSLETFVAHTVRDLAIRTRVRGLTNPVPANDAVIAEGRDHFADHCASCHANDGSGDTEMGRGLYPKAPDMRLPATQNLSDAELFYIIENGVRFTGMPGWSTGTKAGEDSSWHLVHFIRYLPRLTPDEIEKMESLNPKSPEEIRQEIEAEQFLNGADAAPAAPSSTESHAGAGHHE
jgi:mono/diheme cytochrome c family protein